MATSQGTIDHLLDRLAAGGIEAAARKMFGEYGVYLDGRMAALVCDGTLYMKRTASGVALLGAAEEACPYPGAKPLPMVDADRWDESEWLAELFRVTAAELPAPKPTKRKA